MLHFLDADDSVLPHRIGAMFVKLNPEGELAVVPAVLVDAVHQFDFGHRNKRPFPEGIYFANKKIFVCRITNDHLTNVGEESVGAPAVARTPLFHYLKSKPWTQYDMLECVVGLLPPVIPFVQTRHVHFLRDRIRRHCPNFRLV